MFHASNSLSYIYTYSYYACYKLLYNLSNPAMIIFVYDHAIKQVH